MTIEAKMNTDVVLNYEEAKKHLFVRVRNMKDVPMEAAPYTLYGDLAMTYHIALPSSEEEIANAMIRRDLMSHYGITKEALHEAALANAATLFPAHIGSLMGMVENGMETRPFDPENLPNTEILVLSNEKVTYGASAIFYPGIQAALGAKLGDYFILPSSVHEVLILQDDGFFTCQDLQKMVQSVNRFEVEEEDRLSDLVYHYEAATDTFELAMDFECRKPQREGKCS